MASESLVSMGCKVDYSKCLVCDSAAPCDHTVPGSGYMPPGGYSMGTVTGRMSSSKPNISNIPKSEPRPELTEEQREALDDHEYESEPRGI